MFSTSGAGLSESTVVLLGLFSRRLVSEGDPTKGHDVVCKIGWTADHIEALRREKDAYIQLADLQGKFIPCLMGVFEAEEDHGPMLCLIISYVGSPSGKPLAGYPRFVR